MKGIVAVGRLGLWGLVAFAPLAAVAQDPAPEWPDWQQSGFDAAYALLIDQREVVAARSPEQRQAWLSKMAAQAVDFHDTGQLDEARQLAQLTIELGKGWEHPTAVVSGHNTIGLVHWSRGDYPPAVSALTTALKLAEENETVVWRGNAATNLGGVFHEIGDLDLAVELYHRTLDYDRIDGSPAINMSDTLGNLSLVWWDLRDFEKYETYAQQALALRRAHGNADDLTISLSNLGYTALKRGETAMAHAYISEMWSLVDQVEYPVLRAISFTLQACLLASEGAFAEAEAKYAEGQALFTEYGAPAEGNNHIATFAEILAPLPGQAARALELMEAAVAGSRAIGRTNELERIYQQMIPLYRKLGKDELAWQTVADLENHRQSMAKNRQISRAEYLQTQFEVAEISRQIKEARLQNSLSASQLEQARAERNLIIVAGVATLLIALLFIWQFMQARRSHRVIAAQNQQLAGHNEEQRLFMNIASHDLKSPLAAMRLNAQLGSEMAERLAPADVGTMFTQISATAARTLGIVTDFLDGAVDGRSETAELVPLESVTRQLTQDLHTELTRGNLKVDDDGIPGLTLRIPRHRIERCLFNLVLNAIQHSPEGGTITLLGRIEADTLHLSILDEGPGLTAEAGAGAKQSLHRSHGLGLTLARRLLTPYGGTIELVNRRDGVRGAATHLIVSCPE